MKKGILLITTLSLIFCLFGCGSHSNAINPYSGYNLSSAVTLPDYDEYDLSIPEVSVTDEEIKNEIDEHLENASTQYTAITSGIVEKGDVVKISYSGKTADGRENERLSYDNFEIELGSSGFIAGFDENLYGASIGVPTTFYITFPDNYELDETLSGEEVEMTVTVNEKIVRTKPEMNNEFFKSDSSGQASNYEEYKAFIVSQIYNEKLSELLYEAQNRFFAEIENNAIVNNLPEDEIKREYQNTIDWYETLANLSGLSMEEFIGENLEISMEEFEKQANDSAVQMVKHKMTVYALAEKENVYVSDGEYNERINNMVNSLGYSSVEEYEKTTGVSFESYANAYGLLCSMYLDKVLDNIFAD